MITRAPAEPGMRLADVDTPALLVDLDRMEANIAAMAESVARLGVKLRPHAKTHKSPIIGLKQMAAGAVGLCCQKGSEAEAMVFGGVGDVIVTNEVWGQRKLARLASLARHARVGVCVDTAAGIAPLAAVAECFGVRLDVLVEIDVGAGRCGAAPGEPAAELARQIAASPHLRFAGLQAYQGAAQHLRTPGEREQAIAAATARVRSTLDALVRHGLSAEIVGGAGTGTYDLEAESGLWTELQAGSYVFMDADYAKNLEQDGTLVARFGHALFVMATVMSRPEAGRGVVDAGHKALGNDAGFPTVWSHVGARYYRPADEHGMLDLSECAAPPALGERVLLVPGHCDPTVNLYDWYVGIRRMGSADAYVECVWPIAGRGAGA